MHRSLGTRARPLFPSCNPTSQVRTSCAESGKDRHSGSQSRRSTRGGVIGRQAAVIKDSGHTLPSQRLQSSARTRLSRADSAGGRPAGNASVINVPPLVRAKQGPRTPHAARGFLCAPPQSRTLYTPRQYTDNQDMGRRSSRRRCPSCWAALPRDAHPRRRYCSPACVARAYRARKRLGQNYQRVLAAERSPPPKEPTDLGVSCPGCGRQIYPGGRHLRIDARHCSPTCRQREWRQRRREKSS